MEFNRDDVLAFKREGLVGEGNDALLTAFPDAMAWLATEDPRRHALVRDVVREENEDRRTIMQRIVDTNPDLIGAEGLDQVRRILAARYRQEAEPGTMVQLPDGSWIARGD